MINRFIITTILFVPLIFITFTGCRDRDELKTLRCSTPKAEAALKEAEAMLKAAGVPLNFDDPGMANHPERLMPEPENLRDPDKQRNFELAIEQMNVVFEELEREFQLDNSCSVSDMALLHLHLGLVYIFDGVSRLLISDGPPQTFVIKRGNFLEELYTFDVTPDTKAKLDNARQPEEFLNAFTEKERQGIMDLLDLLDDAVITLSVPNMQPRNSSVNRHPYSRYAIWHFRKAASLFGQYDPKIQKSLEDFNGMVDEMRARIQEKTESWGFIYTLPPGR